MANPFTKIQDHVFFDWREVAVALVKQRGIHEGLWRAGVGFDTHSFMANQVVKSGASQKRPAILNVIENVNLKQMTEKEADELTIDAAEENPRPRLLGPDGLHLN